MFVKINGETRYLWRAVDHEGEARDPYVTKREWAIAAGGHTRTGLEDNMRLERTTLAPSNAALVRRAV